MLEYNKIFLILSHIFVFTSFVLVMDWIIGGSKENNLGGLYPISMTNEQSNSYQYVFNWHPFMMVTGMLFCVVEAILSFQTFHLMNSSILRNPSSKINTYFLANYCNDMYDCWSCCCI